MQKVLVLIPSKNAKGGISNYYLVLKEYLSSNYTYFVRGARKQPFRGPKLFLLLLYIFDIIRFIIKLSMSKIDVILLNTSLGKAGMYRDAVFILIAKMFRKQVIVFFRGLDISIQDQISKKYKRVFKIFFKSDKIISLSTAFNDKLSAAGFIGNLYKETTVIENDISSYFLKKDFNSNIIKLIYLARIEKEKGIYELAIAFDKLQKKFDNISLSYVGDGNDLKSLKEFVLEKNISNIDFKGYLYGENKYKAYAMSHIYILPSYSEGIPNSLLEAMALGCPSVVTNVGGISDFFQDEVNGKLLSAPPQPNDIYNACVELISDEEKLFKISQTNINYAMENFPASKVAKRLDAIIQQI
jgi:glycosyltransferase involved in cell wall biosynthesis